MGETPEEELIAVIDEHEQSRKGAHVIDPRTGLPARTGLEEVSVVAATGVEAEVVAKAALLAGPEVAPVYCAVHALAWWLSP